MTKVRASTLFMASILLLMVAGLVVSPVWADSPVGERPDWCKPGFVCMKTPDAAALLIKVEMLEEQVGILKAKSLNKLGWAATCGPAASLSTTDSNTTLAGTLSCVVGFGYRF